MAYLLLAIIAIGLLLIATELVNRINRAVVAMFIGVSCWLLYIANGSSFVLSEHPIDFLSFVSAKGISIYSVKDFIANHIFLKYVAQCAEIVLFLMATTIIAEVLNNNGCFDFIQKWLKFQTAHRFIWITTAITFVLSANIDNLTTTILLLSIIHPLLKESKSKRVVTANIIIAACTGGSITVIGDMSSLKLWNDGLVTPTNYFLMMVLPITSFQLFITYSLSHLLPNRLQYKEVYADFQGDDNTIRGWQKIIFFILGIGGLWFIPTFHRITLLPPFVGTLCVLSLIWTINELFNHSLMNTDKMIHKRMPIALQYANTQNLQFFIGISLMFGALAETGLLSKAHAFVSNSGMEYFLTGCMSTVMSALFGSISTIVCNVNLYTSPLHPMLQSAGNYGCDAPLWALISYSSAIGGVFLATSSVAGLLMARTGHITFWWYAKHITPKVCIGFIIGLLCLCTEIAIII